MCLLRMRLRGQEVEQVKSEQDVLYMEWLFPHTNEAKNILKGWPFDT